MPIAQDRATETGNTEGQRGQAVCKAPQAGRAGGASEEDQVGGLQALWACDSTLTRLDRIDYGVGTPDRLVALLEEGALSTANLKRVVIDVSYIDQKKRGILDMKELHEAAIKRLLL